MHANAALLHELFTALHRHDHETMASCYYRDDPDDPEVRFRDIAFSLKGRDEIHSMWRMICDKDVHIQVDELEVLDADDRAGRVRLVETYTFHTLTLPPREVPVRNAIESRFLFKDGRIWRHDDECDAKAWAVQTMGHGPAGFLAGRVRLLRSVVARIKLARFLKREQRAMEG